MAAARQVKVEILGDAKGLSSAFGAAEKAAGGFTGFIGKIGGGLATFGLAANGIGVIGNALGGFVSSALEGERAMAQTEAVIKSTGGAAGMTAQQVADLADGFEKMTPFSAEAVQEGENLLLTFTNIGKDVFPQATETMLDMATALGTDAKGGAIQLGKALNDPVKGIAALSRVGVTFTAQQKEQIKAMVAAGDVAGAQTVILQELQKEFGGSAKAAGETFAGKLEILKNRMGNLQEVIGAALIPALIKLADKAMPFVERGVEKLAQILPVVLTWVGRLAERLQGPLMKAFVLIRDGWLTLFQALSGDWSDNENIVGLHRVIGNIGLVIREQVIPAVMSMADFFQNSLWPAIQQGVEIVANIIGVLNEQGLGGALDALGAKIVEVAPTVLAALASLLEQMGTWIADTGLPLLGEKLMLWGQAFIDWIGPRIVPILTALGELLLAVGEWIATVAAPAIGAKLLEWGNQFVAWVGPQVGPLLGELGNLLAQVGGWIVNTALPTIISNLSQWAQAFVAWVAPQIGPLLSELGNLLAQLGSWLINTALPEIGAKLAEWGLAFVKWVGPQIPPLLLELGQLLLAINVWIFTEALPAIRDRLGEWGLAFIGWIATDVLPKLPGALADIAGTITGWIASVDWGGMLYDAGVALIQGLINGIGSLLGSLKSKIDEITNLLIIDVPGFSPPYDAGYEQGQRFVQGLSDGVRDTTGMFDRSIGEVTDRMDLGGAGSGNTGGTGTRGTTGTGNTGGGGTRGTSGSGNTGGRGVPRDYDGPGFYYEKPNNGQGDGVIGDPAYMEIPPSGHFDNPQNVGGGKSFGVFGERMATKAAEKIDQANDDYLTRLDRRDNEFLREMSRYVERIVKSNEAVPGATAKAVRAALASAI